MSSSLRVNVTERRVGYRRAVYRSTHVKCASLGIGWVDGAQSLLNVSTEMLNDSHGCSKTWRSLGLTCIRISGYASMRDSHE